METRTAIIAKSGMTDLSSGIFRKIRIPAENTRSYVHESVLFTGVDKPKQADSMYETDLFRCFWGSVKPESRRNGFNRTCNDFK